MIPTRPPSPHPSAEALYRARSEPGEAAARHILEHAALCAECSAELAHLERFDHPKPEPLADLEAGWSKFGEPAARTATRRSVPPLRLVFVGLAAVLAIFGAGVLLVTRRPAADFGPARGGRSLDLLSPEGTLQEAPRQFVFAGTEDPARVMVFDAAREFSWTSDPDQTGRVLFPEAQRLQLKPGVDYYWTVLSDGEEGPVKSFRLGAPAGTRP